MPASNHHSARESRAVRLGDPVLDRYLEFVESRARHNTLLATASDLKAFFGVVDKAPAEVAPADVLGFIAAPQRKPRGDGRVVRLADGESGLAARTIKRRLSSISGLFSYLVLCGDVTRNPVPRGLATRRGGGRGSPLIRSPRTLPKILSPDEVNALMVALRTRRDRAMVEAMLLGGLRRCEVLGLRFEDLRPGENQVFVANGKGELLSTKIDPEVLQSEDREMLQDLVTAAGNDALRKARELLSQEVAKLAGGLGLPPGLL
jgi:integrase/recombinase XerD